MSCPSALPPSRTCHFSSVGCLRKFTHKGSYYSCDFSLKPAALLLSSIGLTASIAAVSGGVHRVAGVSGTGLAAFGISALIACHAWWHGGLGRDGPRGGGSSACGAARRSVIAVAAAVILVSAAAARDASTPGNSLCEEDLRRGQNRDRCASELAWTLGTAIGSCAWVRAIQLNRSVPWAPLLQRLFAPWVCAKLPTLTAHFLHPPFCRCCYEYRLGKLWC